MHETRLVGRQIDGLKLKLEFENCLTVDSEGRSGGLYLMWRSEVNLKICSYSKNHIDVVVDDEGLNGQHWRIIGCYCHLETSKKSETWDLLILLNSANYSGWLVLGDFNEIISRHEKRGGGTNLKYKWKVS